MAIRGVKRIRPADRELAEVQDNLATVLEQLMTKADGPVSKQIALTPVLEQPRGPGTPTSVKTLALQVEGRPDGNLVQNQSTVVFGNPAQISPNAVTTAQRDALLTLYGQILAYSSTSTASTIYIVPQTTGMVFTVASIGNTTRVFQIDHAGNVTGQNFTGQIFTGQSFVSAAGFKNVMPIGKFQNNNYAANAAVALGDMVQNQGGLGGTSVVSFIHRVSHNGSIVGLNLSSTGTNAGTQSLIFFRNGSQSYNWQAGTGAGNNFITFPKATIGLQFLAGDVLTFSFRSTTANNVTVQAFATLEMVA